MVYYVFSIFRNPPSLHLLYSVSASQDVLQRRAVLARKEVNFVPVDVILAMGAQISRQNMGIWLNCGIQQAKKALPPLNGMRWDIQLTDKHRQILQSSQWVDDEIVAASQNLLHQQHPGVGSIQSPILTSQLAMEPQGGREFVQIVNIGNNHWITLSTVGCQPGHINVYDSLHICLSSNVKELIADLLQLKDSSL